MNKLFLLAAVASLAFGGSAHATLINGSIAVGADGSGSYSGSTLTLSPTNIVESGAGDLNIDFGSSVAASGAELSGLSSSATPESVSDYFEFAAPGILSSAGTTPQNRFLFDLTGVTETNATYGDFTGTGVLIDTTGALQATNATFSLAFSGPTNYSFSLGTTGVAAPEPSTWALALAGMGGLLFFARRLRAA